MEKVITRRTLTPVSYTHLDVYKRQPSVGAVYEVHRHPAPGGASGFPRAVRGQRRRVAGKSDGGTGAVPVSYTHLDVYKRQVYGLPIPTIINVLISINL